MSLKSGTGETVRRARLRCDVDVLASRRPGAMVVIAVGLVLGGCRSVNLRDGVVVTPDTRYRIGPIPADWYQVNLKDSDFSWVTSPSEYAFWVNSTCKDYQDIPLVALNRQLLIGFTDVKKVEQQTETLDGREALYTHYVADMDGVARALGIVVVKKDNCVYDFAYVSPVGAYANRFGQFQALYRGFATEAQR